MVPIQADKKTAEKATSNETLAPKITRLSTSLPMVSVPNGNVNFPPSSKTVGISRSLGSPISGLWGAMKSAKMAARKSMNKIAAGILGMPRKYRCDSRRM
jgi:hypothetical protein